MSRVIERRRSMCIPLQASFGSAGPDKPDPQAVETGKPLAPVRGARRVGAQVRRRGGNGFERRAEGARQAHQRTVQIKRRQPVAPSDDLR